MYSCDLDPPFETYDYVSHHAARSGNRKNQCSEAMSRALGGFNSRYEGAGSAIRQAREISNEHQRYYAHAKPTTPRGPCPQFLVYAPSMPSIIADADRKSA